jgi:DNA-binding MarR family transcriptional regulator
VEVPIVPDNSDWLTQQEIATITGKEIREVREAVRNLRRAGVIQTTTSPEDERVILVHKSSLDLVKSALRVSA